MKRILMAAACALSVAGSHAQVPPANTAFLVCESLIKCERQTYAQLSATTRSEIGDILRNIPKGSSLDDVQRNFGKPGEDITSFMSDLTGKPVRVMSAKFMLTKDESPMAPHVDVMFFDGKAVHFRVWRDSLRRRVEVSY